MQVTNGDIWAATTAKEQEPTPMQELLAEKWPVKTRYWLARLAQALGKERAVIEQVRMGLIRQYGTADEKGNVVVQPGGETWPEFAKEFNELMAQEVDIEGIKPINLPERKDDEEEYKDAVSLIPMLPFIEIAED